MTTDNNSNNNTTNKNTDNLNASGAPLNDNSSPENKSAPKAKKSKKPQGPIRWNAIIPFLIVCSIFYAYFYFFFDSNMKSILEWGAYKALGVEVNIKEFKSSFVHGNVKISKIEITDSKQPDYNAIELGDVHFDVNWDALLKLKLVIEEIAVEGVQFMSKRAHPGKVDPPPPPSNEPSFSSQLEKKALDKIDKENKNNILGDISQFLKNGNSNEQIKNLESQLESKKMLQEMNTKWTLKKTDWDAKLKSLPSSKELNAIKDRFGKIKYKDFKTPQELETSLKELDAVVKDVDGKSKQIQEVKNQLDADLKGLDQDYKNLDAQIKKDIDALKARFKIPKIDAASFAKALFMDYLGPVVQKVDHYKTLAEKYLPPKYAKMVKGEKQPAEKEDNTIQPHPRAKGVTYEFPIENGYPLFWIQKIKISSTSNSHADYGDFAGLIRDITSNQKQVGKPTTIDIHGDFKKMNISAIKLNAELNNTQKESVVKFNLGVGSYILQDLKLMNSKDANISIPSSNTSVVASGQIIGFKNYDMKFKNEFNNVDFKVDTQDKTVSDLLSQTFSSIKKFDLEATAKGELKDLDLEIKSSLASDLQNSFEKLLKNKINEANEKLQSSINSEIGKLKSQVQGQTDAIKNQAQAEINKIQSQINDQKKQTEDKVNVAKKDAENQAKNKLQQEGQKQLDDLKNKLGF